MKNRNEIFYSATAVSIGGFAVLITGKSGSGKSDLALRLIDRGGVLIADDKTVLKKTKNGIYAFPHDAAKGMLEIRGVGIIKMRITRKKKVIMLINLDGKPERFPETFGTADICGTALPCINLDASEASAPLKVEAAITRIRKPQQFVL